MEPAPSIHNFFRLITGYGFIEHWIVSKDEGGFMCRNRGSFEGVDAILKLHKLLLHQLVC